MTQKLNTGSHDLPVSAASPRSCARAGPTPGARPGRAADRPLGGQAAAPRSPPASPASGSSSRRGRSRPAATTATTAFRPHSAFAWLTGRPASQADVLVIEPSTATRPRCTCGRARRARTAAGVLPRPPLRRVLGGPPPRPGRGRAALPDRLRPPRRPDACSPDPRGCCAAWTRRSTRWPPTATPSWRRSSPSCGWSRTRGRSAELQLAVDATTRGFEDVVRALPAALAHPAGERYLEGVFGLRARLEGNAVGYDSIVASGAHACVLHWIRNDGRLNAATCCCSTRAWRPTPSTPPTSPARCRCPAASPRCSARSYELVLRGPGRGRSPRCGRGRASATSTGPAMRVIAEGLADWGVLQIAGRADGVEACTGATRCAAAATCSAWTCTTAPRRAAEVYLDGVLEEGQVLTVEPGLYLQPDDVTLPPELRGHRASGSRTTWSSPPTAPA